ncbi:aspartate aminotransferase family protein [Prosthecomicrobium pneumaticum]|uniref:Glutamate-1-semialdehyde 2,1-aminomutase n=1 Tax=Prosthecomicrobium pneumaticum TaxID=81895 RepID=A0A7W9CUJ2_9HYPH|nr:aspartate aminotransferase family protein [Prosthecomicrobium pneumaticum]MBB5751776.1 glutamate-1-semialdehyde 2,1-aminomutase [Prosthecomicrobium pneumaticum]
MPIDAALRERAQDMIATEEARFAALHPRSSVIAATAANHFPGGVPLHWMRDWGTPFPLVVARAEGSTVTCADGIAHTDFCLGDSGALFGHSPAPVVAAITAQAAHGLTAMLPSTDVAEVAGLLADRFGLPYWQVTATASDANRAVIRWARAITGRAKVLVFDGCYHGQVDDAFVEIRDEETVMRAGLLGQVHDLASTSSAVPFNDLEAVEWALSTDSIALVLTEPALTNTGMVLPDPGFLEGLVRLARRHGALVAFDETHTISTGPAGYCGLEGLEPDFFVLGKPVAGGVPAAVFGFSAAVEAEMRRTLAGKPEGYSGIGTTLSGNMLALAAMRACLAEVMTEDAYRTMIRLAGRLADGIEAVLEALGLPWSVARLGARVELVFAPAAVRNGAEARAALDHTVERALHLHLLNRGVLVTPFHNMMLVAPTTTAAEVDRLVGLLAEALESLTGRTAPP